MNCFAQELKKLLIGCVKEVEAWILKDPVFCPIKVSDAVLVYVFCGVTKAMIVRWQFGQIVKSRQKVVVLELAAPIDLAGCKIVKDGSPGNLGDFVHVHAFGNFERAS